MSAQAYVYRRFSSDEQEKGSGQTLLRQQERCEAFAVEHGWTLAGEPLTDKGKSAFKGEHLFPDGELGKFVGRVMSGEIKRGSVLVAERLDRLSRRPVGEAMAWIHMMTNAGIVVAIADTRIVFDTNQDMGSFLNAAIQLGVGHDESRKKSDQTILAKRKLWKATETRTGPWTNLATKLPTWLTRNDARDGFIVDEDRARIVREIFTQSANGVGVNTITRFLNEDGVPPFSQPTRYKNGPHRWGRSAVRQLLMSPNVEGDLVFKSGIYSGRTVSEFFPRIVDADLVVRARADLKARKKEAGSSAKGGTTNLFAGVTTCGVCGRRAFLSTSVQKGKAYPYLRCEAAQERRCDNTNGFAYRAFEDAVLDLFLDLSMDDRFFEATDELREGRARKAEIEKALNDTRARKTRLMEAFGDGDGDAMILINKATADINDLISELTSLDQTIATATGKVSNAEHLRRVGDIREAAGSDIETVRVQARGKLRQAMSAIIMSVEIDRDHDGQKFFTVILTGGIMAVRIDTKGQVLKAVSDASGHPLHTFLTDDQKAALAPVISRIANLAA